MKLVADFDEATAMVEKHNAHVMDIGCNDGTLLTSYPKAFIEFGIAQRVRRVPVPLRLRARRTYHIPVP